MGIVPVSKLGSTFAQWFPELEHFQTPVARRRAFRRATRRALSTPLYWGFALACTALGVWVKFVVERIWHVPPLVLAILLGLYAGAAIGYGGIWAFRRRIRVLLRQKLIEEGVPVCVQCGYMLKGVILPRCPECGTAF